MTLTSTKTLKSVCDVRGGVHSTATYGAENIPENFRDSDPWTVQLRYQGRSMTVPFFMGPALCREPSTKDVLECLLSDASFTENCRDEYDLAEELGEQVTRASRATWLQMVKNAGKLHNLLGDDYRHFMYDLER
jgi:hypothetical protein